jgi:hypothetical protein
MSRGYEMGATVLNGLLRRTEDGTWVIDDDPLGERLRPIEGQQVIFVVAPIGEAAGRTRVCSVCGREYEGYECPHCRQARRRLRRR